MRAERIALPQPDHAVRRDPGLAEQVEGGDVDGEKQDYRDQEEFGTAERSHRWTLDIGDSYSRLLRRSDAVIYDSNMPSSTAAVIG